MTADAPADSPHAFGQLRGHLLKGNMDAMRNDPLGFYTHAQRTCGHYTRFHVVPGIHGFLLTHPDAIEQVLYKNHKNFRKPDRFYNAVSLLVGNGLFTSEGELWTRQRKLIQPAFHSFSLARFVPSINTAVTRFIEEQQARLKQQGEQSQPVDIDQAMMKLGLAITNSTLFSSDLGGDADAVGKAFRTAFAHMGHHMNSAQLLPDWLPTPANLRFGRAKKLLDGVVLDLINQRKAKRAQSQQTTANDFLDMLLSARDEETGQGIEERQLMDEILTLLTAAHENIGAALTWTWRVLAQHPEIQSDVYDELHAQLRGGEPSNDDLPRLPLTRAVFEEAMRLYPPGWGELRESIHAQDLQGHPLPAKALIVLCQWVTHRHPDFWPDPLTFDPQRFMPGQSQKHHRFAYFPFGGGPRVCIGMQLAIMEGIIVIARVLQQFLLTPADDRPVVPDATFTLRPRHGLKVILKPRSINDSLYGVCTRV